MENLQANKVSTSIDKKQDDYQKMFKKQYICKMVLIVVGLVFCLLIHKIYVYQTAQESKDSRKGSIYEFLTYGTVFALLYTVFDHLLHKHLQDIFSQKFLAPNKYTQPDVRKKRCYTMVKWFYSIFFYSGCSIANFILLSQTGYFPTSFGGQNGYESPQLYCFKLEQAYFAITMLYMIEYGKHISRLIIHAFIRRQGNYYEFTLHHGLSVALIVFSYLTNLWLPGMFVLFTHDASDALLLIARFYKDYQYSKSLLVNILGLIGVGSWIVLRGVLFPIFVVYPVIDKFMSLPSQNPISQMVFMPGMYIGLMLLSLFVMDLIWIQGLIAGLLKILKQSSSKTKKGN